jgi:hypothetical protein
VETLDNENVAVSQTDITMKNNAHIDDNKTDVEDDIDDNDALMTMTLITILRRYEYTRIIDKLWSWTKPKSSNIPPFEFCLQVFCENLNQ